MLTPLAEDAQLSVIERPGTMPVSLACKLSVVCLFMLLELVADIHFPCNEVL